MSESAVHALIAKHGITVVPGRRGKRPLTFPMTDRRSMRRTWAPVQYALGNSARRGSGRSLRSPASRGCRLARWKQVRTRAVKSPRETIALRT